MNCFICDKEALENYDPIYLSRHFICPNCGEYYLEIGFKSRLDLLLAIKGDDKEKVIKREMQRLVRKNNKVLFLGTYEAPLLKNIGDDVIHIELPDILNRLKIYVEDKSRGSDYGD